MKCWAPLCNHDNAKHSCSFFTFPTDANIALRWRMALGRKEKPGSGARVCSCHFRDNKKENGPKSKTPMLSPRKGQQNDPEPETVPSTSSTSPNSTAVYEAEIDLLKQQIDKLKSSKAFSFNDIKNKEQLVTYYTGLPNSQSFYNLLKLLTDGKQIHYYYKWEIEKMPNEDQLFICLMKLRHNYDHLDLAVRFGVSQATISNIVVSWIYCIHAVLFLQLMSSIPLRQKNKTCLPTCYSTFNCRIDFDCSEVTTDVPKKSLAIQKETGGTLKGLVGVAPNGCITFVSDLYPGSTSDKEIVQSCNILSEMEMGDLILADEGFLIKDTVPEGVRQFTPYHIQQTEAIARARMLVERSIGRMKAYKILQHIPESMVCHASHVFQVIGALTNLQPRLMKEVKDELSDASDATDTD